MIFTKNVGILVNNEFVYISGVMGISLANFDLKMLRVYS